LIDTEKRSGAGRRAGKLFYETPMSRTAASASPNVVGSNMELFVSTAFPLCCIEYRQRNA
jgi:hypothetical protein